MATRTFCILISLMLASCAAPQDELVGNAPPTELAAGPTRTDRIQLEKAPVARPTNNPEALVTIDGWPFQEEGRRFTLTWNSGSEPVPLVDIPSLNGIPVAEATFQRGEVIRWSQSNVGIFRPSTYRVKAPVGVEGFTYGASYRTGDEQFYAELKKGQQVYMYHYLGSGLCLLEVDRKLVEAMCPRPESYVGNFKGADDAMKFQPAERIWWVYLGAAGKGGWMIVDNRVVVDVE
ncbi:MAG: hypothetical protein R3E66_19115 [bacterium]